MLSNPVEGNSNCRWRVKHRRENHKEQSLNRGILIVAEREN
jgi:hypothetical protein